MQDLRIDPEFRDVLPTNEQRYKDLEAAVLKDGFFTDPFITWNGYIIDGHTRYRIMQNHPEIDFKPYEKKMDSELADRYAVIVWIATHQLSRRNLDLNGFEWAEVHKKAYDAEKMQEKFHGNRYTKSSEFDSELTKNGEDPRSHAGETATVLAQKFGMKSASQFKHSVRLANAMEEGEKYIPGFKDKLKNGDIKASKNSVESILNFKDENDKKAHITAIVKGESPSGKRPKPVGYPKETRDRMKLADEVISEMYSPEIKEFTIEMLESDIEINGMEYVSVLRNTLTDHSTMLTGENRARVVAKIDGIIAEIQKLRRLAE